MTEGKLITYILSHPPSSAPMYGVNLCFECSKEFFLKSEKERKIKERLHRRVCPNGKIVMIIYIHLDIYYN